MKISCSASKWGSNQFGIDFERNPFVRVPCLFAVYVFFFRKTYGFYFYK